jgi:protease-4
MMRRLFLLLWSAGFVAALGAPAAPPEKDGKKTETKPRLAVFRLSGSISEAGTQELPILSGPGGVSLKDLVTRLKKAKDDPAVKAIVLLPEGGSIGPGQVEELRQVMGEIRTAGKDIFVHADGLSMREYVLASGASRISMVPTGDLTLTGLYSESIYVRGLLDKIGAKPDFLTCGDYKSAAEMFMREGPSPQAEKMQNWLLDSVYETLTDLIAKGRNVDAAKARAWVDGGPYWAEKAKAEGLIDAVEPRQEFATMLKKKFGDDVVFDKKYGKKDEDDLASMGVLKIWSELLSGPKKKKKSGKSAVAIVYVDGPIVMSGNDGFLPFTIGGAKGPAIRKHLDQVAADDGIKAVVLRVDSPGGSAVASDIILDATKRVKAKKPFVVSMGDVAGSGGYYVACGADVIFADAATITGSIGVVSGKLATTGAWNKIGVTFKSYKRGANAGMLTSRQAFSPEERQRMQAMMDAIYGVFKNHVVGIRGSRLKKPIDAIAGGRVYTGKQALDLGLVDKIGTLQDAIAYIAGEAKLTDYEVRVVPEPKNFMEQLIEDMTGGSKDDSPSLDVETRRRALHPRLSLVDLALPHLQYLDPDRVKAVKVALERLQLLNQEGVIMMMPEILFSK